jgi:hypothetical protein
VVVVLHMNWRGLFSLGTNAAGGTSTTPMEWPGFRTTAYHSMGETQESTKNWMGSLLEASATPAARCTCATAITTGPLASSRRPIPCERIAHRPLGLLDGFPPFRLVSSMRMKECLRLAYVIPVVLISACYGGGKRTEKFAAELNEAIPLGTHADRVLILADSMNLRHTAYDSVSQTIGAHTRDRARFGIAIGFQAVFHFDTADVLVSREVTKTRTGP